MRIAYIAIGACALSACSTLHRSRPTLEADPAEFGGEGLIYQNELMLAYEKVDDNKICEALLPSYQESQKWSYDRYKVNGRDAAEIFRCMRFTPIKSGSEGKAQIARHVQAGLALSDLYCRNYFARIALHSRKRGFWRTSTNDVGTAISGILGLASAGANTTAGAGVAFGLADGFFRNYDESFLVGPDLAAVQKAVFDTQAELKKTITQGMPTNFADANMDIKRHADACSFIGMKRLINERVSGPTNNSREELLNYLANLQITQEDINKQAEAQRKAAEEARRAEEEARAAEDLARKANEAPTITQPQQSPPSTQPETAPRDDR